jgi:ribulose-phosphate 3-epimerase
MIKISPSILSADFTKLGEGIKALEAAGADMIHIDVMDGHFVPNLTFGPVVIEHLRRVTQLPFDVHLMIESPEWSIESYANAGADIITFHYEAVSCHEAVSRHPELGSGSKSTGGEIPKQVRDDGWVRDDVSNALINKIKSLGAKAGISLLPSTEPQVLDNIITNLDLILVMSVNPGFGGQEFMENQIDKIKYLSHKIKELDKDIILSVDGGINPTSARKCINAGANMLVSGSFIFGSKDYKGAIDSLRASKW